MQCYGHKARLLVSVCLFILLAGCNPASEQKVIPSATHVQNGNIPARVVTEPEASQNASNLPSMTASTTKPSATEVSTSTVPVLTKSDGSLVVDIYSDTNVVVTTSSYKVEGHAPDGTVVSANDQIVVVDRSQSFSLTVPLADGPNLIDIVASDWSGHEVDFSITVTYNS